MNLQISDGKSKYRAKVGIITIPAKIPSERWPAILEAAFPEAKEGHCRIDLAENVVELWWPAPVPKKANSVFTSAGANDKTETDLDYGDDVGAGDVGPGENDDEGIPL